MIPQETIEQVRQATDIAQIIGDYVRLKKRGRNFEGLCPFHTEKTPSFKVNTDRQIYHCFGCGKGGNVFSFLMEHDKMSFIEAVRHCATKANITIRETQTDFRREQVEKLNYAHSVATEYFHKLLFNSKYKTVLVDYLMGKRQIKREHIELFKLGLSGEEWDGLIKYAKTKDLSTDDLSQAGLVIFSESNKSYHDRFRQRLMIPIFNLAQKPIAFGGRTLKKGEPAKYINSPETPLYSKSFVLYGLNYSKDYIRETGFAYIVEGYFDFISLWQAGVKNVVASSGTAFTQQQARLLARFCENVFLFFDADSAGQNAALRSVDHLFDSGIEVKVMPSVEGEDPDTIARKFGLQEIERLKGEASPFIQFRVKNVNLQESGIIGKEKLIKELGGLASRIGDPTRRSLFIMEASQVLSVDQAIFLSNVIPVEEKDTRAETRRTRQYKLEIDYLSLLLANRGSVDYALETVAPDDLDSKELHRLYLAMIQQYRTHGVIDANRLVENLADESSISLLTEIAAIDWEPNSVEVETRRYVQEIYDRKRKRIRASLQKELELAEASGDHNKANSILEQMKGYGL